MIPWSPRFLKILGINPDRLYYSWSSPAHKSIAYTCNKYLKTLNTTYTIKDDGYILTHPDVVRNFDHWADNITALEEACYKIENELKPFEALHYILDLAQPLHAIDKIDGGYDKNDKRYKEGNINDEIHNRADHILDAEINNYTDKDILYTPIPVTASFHDELLKLWNSSHVIAMRMDAAKKADNTTDPLAKIQNHQMSIDEARTQFIKGVAVCILYLYRFKDNKTIKPDVVNANPALNKYKITSATDDIFGNSQEGAELIDFTIDNFDFPEISTDYKISDLIKSINESNLNNVNEQISIPSKYLSSTCESEINRMVAGESLLRIGDIWLGKDKYSTVTGFSVFTNKQIGTVQPLRSDLALSMSTSMSPVDSVQVEIICHVKHMQSIVQRLTIMTEISPSIPIMNTALTAIMQPIHHNKKIYEAYGIKTGKLCGSKLTVSVEQERELLKAYASVPMWAHIDNLNISYAGPRDIRLLVTLSRTLTTNSYGDRVLFCQTMKDSYDQHMFMSKFRGGAEDTNQIKSYGAIFGVYNENINQMVETLTQIPRSQANNYAPFKAIVSEIEDGDTLKVYKTDSRTKDYISTIRLFGIDAPEGESYAAYINKIPKAIIDVRLNERFDAVPEVCTSVQPYAKEAKEVLTKLLGIGNNKKEVEVVIQPYGFDSTGYRLLAEVFVSTKAGLKCINYEMVKRGMAYVHNEDITMDKATIATMTKYYEAQASAKKEKIGVWNLPEDKRELPSVFRNRVKEAIQLDTHKWRFQG